MHEAKFLYLFQRKDQFPYIQFIDRVKPSKLVSETREYDEVCIVYVTVFYMPMMLIIS